MRSRTGAWRIASPARATAPRSPASSTTRCAGARRAPTSWATKRPRAVAARHAAARAQARSRGDRAACRRRAVRAAAARREASARGSPPRASTARRPRSPATIRNGSIRISTACSARSARPKARRWRSRAPLDLRVNTLKSDRDKARWQRSPILHPQPTRWSPLGLRIALAAEAKNPAIHAEPAFIKGLVEVQDEGSQLAALLAGGQARASRWSTSAPAPAARRWRSRRRWTTAASSMPPIATSAGSRRFMRGSSARARATCRCARRGRGSGELGRSARPHGSRADRRALHRQRRLAAQPRRQVAGAARRARRRAATSRPRRSTARRSCVKPGGRIAYVTCSVLAEENGDQVRAFSRRHPDFATVPPRRGRRTRSASAPICFAAPC